jgi:hypothetical protein
VGSVLCWCSVGKVMSFGGWGVFFGREKGLNNVFRV